MAVCEWALPYNKVSTIDSNIWNNISELVEMFIIFMKSPFPVAYVDMTYEFLLNMIPTGIYNDFKASPKTIPCTYSPCRTLGENIVRIVSLKKISIYYKFTFLYFSHLLIVLNVFIQRKLKILILMFLMQLHVYPNM